jgi:hypothetical protein
VSEVFDYFKTKTSSPQAALKIAKNSFSKQCIHYFADQNQPDQNCFCSVVGK